MVKSAVCSATTSDNKDVDSPNSVLSSTNSTPKALTTPPHRNVTSTAAIQCTTERRMLKYSLDNIKTISFIYVTEYIYLHRLLLSFSAVDTNLLTHTCMLIKSDHLPARINHDHPSSIGWGGFFLDCCCCFLSDIFKSPGSVHMKSSQRIHIMTYIKVCLLSRPFWGDEKSSMIYTHHSTNQNTGGSCYHKFSRGHWVNLKNQVKETQHGKSIIGIILILQTDIECF